MPFVLVLVFLATHGMGAVKVTIPVPDQASCQSQAMKTVAAWQIAMPDYRVAQVSCLLNHDRVALAKTPHSL